MRNKNIIYIVIGIALILILSIGYAIFSESIQIKGTAKADATFDISTACYTGIYSGIDVSEESLITGYNPEGGYENDTATPVNNNNGCQFSVHLKYPGAGRYFTTLMTNNGTLDAYVPVAVFDDDISTKKFCYDANDDGTISDPSECQSTFFENTDITDNSDITSIIYFTVLDSQGNEENIVDDSFMPTHMGGDDGEGNPTHFKLLPGETLVFVGRIFLPNDQSLYTTTNGMNIKVELSKTYNFTQNPA